jgi:hypothetical protein
MKTEDRTPTLIQEVGTLAGLYRTVFWMMGKRLQYGPDWEERLTEHALHRPQRSPEHANPPPPRHDHN